MHVKLSEKMNWLPLGLQNCFVPVCGQDSAGPKDILNLDQVCACLEAKASTLHFDSIYLLKLLALF